MARMVTATHHRMRLSRKQRIQQVTALLTGSKLILPLELTTVMSPGPGASQRELLNVSHFPLPISINSPFFRPFPSQELSLQPPRSLFFFFLGLHPQHMEVPRLGVESELRHSHSNHQIRAESSTYPTAHSNTGSLTHSVRLGIEPVASLFLVGFVSTAPRR